MDYCLIVQLLGWIGCILVLVARALIAYKKRIGFSLAVLGGIAIGVQAALMNNWGIVAMSVILGLIDSSGWLYWKDK